MTVAINMREQNARRFLGIAATLGVVGVATNLNGDGTLPKVVAAASIIALIWSIHRYGRLGPDEPIVFAAAEPEAPRKKKKKKKRDAEPSDSVESPPQD